VDEMDKELDRINHDGKNILNKELNEIDDRVITEWCPHCKTEVELENKREPQKCPSCGKLILPCSLCEYDKVRCGKCEFLCAVENCEEIGTVRMDDGKLLCEKHACKFSKFIK